MKKYLFIAISLILFSTVIYAYRKNVYYMPLFAKHGKVVDQLDGVNVYFNDRFKSNSGVNVSPCGYRIGLKYQCVEFVKRYYFEHYNHKMTNPWGHARDFFNPKLADGQLNNDRGLKQYKNGSKSKPQKGDLMVYTNGQYGHVAIISEVSDKSVTIMQQNAGRLRPTRMKHNMTYKNGKWYVEKAVLAGWLRKG